MQTPSNAWMRSRVFTLPDFSSTEISTTYDVDLQRVAGAEIGGAALARQLRQLFFRALQ